jgi:hypothetical protein
MYKAPGTGTTGRIGTEFLAAAVAAKEIVHCFEAKPVFAGFGNRHPANGID